MAYTPNPTWTDNSTPAINAAALNHIETGLQSAAAVADSAFAVPSAPYTATSGLWQPPSNMLSCAGANPVNGALIAAPFDVGPVAVSYNQIGINITTALVGGTTPAMRLGLYRDGGSGGSPVGGALIQDSGNVASLTATGNVGIGFSQTLSPGRYWLAACYTYASAPTTPLVVSSLNNAIGMPGAFWTNGYRGWVASGVAAGALPSTFPAASASLTSIICVGLRAT